MVLLRLPGQVFLLDQKISEVHEDIGHQHGLFIGRKHQNQIGKNFRHLCSYFSEIGFWVL